MERTALVRWHLGRLVIAVVVIALVAVAVLLVTSSSDNDWQPPLQPTILKSA